MRVLHLTADLSSGAGRSVYRLHRALRQVQVDSRLLVRRSRAVDDDTIIAPTTLLGRGARMVRASVRALPLAWYPQHQRPFSVPWLPDGIAPAVRRLQPDVVNLHAVQTGFVRAETLARLGRPLVWTLHNAGPFTGGCHFTQGCDRYTNACGACPQLGSRRDGDLSRWVWQRKQRAWRGLTLTIVSPSRWLADCARASSLFRDHRIEVIPYGLDLGRFHPIDRVAARQSLQLPLDRSLILFGAATSSRRKGFHLLQVALQRLAQAGWRDRGDVVIFGGSHPTPPSDLGLHAHYLGKLHDDISLARAYSAADVFVAPSIEDNLPNTVMEALACGTPAVAFAIGGMPDMIEHQANGYLVHPFQVEDLSQGIVWVTQDRQRWQDLSARARTKAEQEFTEERQARRYLSLFHEISGLPAAP